MAISGALTGALPVVPSSSLFDSILHPYRPLEERIQHLGEGILLNEQERNDLRKGVSLCHRWIFKPQGVQASFHNLPIENVKQIVEGILVDALEKDVAKELKRFLEILSNKQIQALAGLSSEEQVILERNIKAALKDHALQNLSKVGKAFWKEILPELKWLFNHVVSMFVSLTGVDEIMPEKTFDNRINMYYAQSRIEFYGKMILLPTTIFAIIGNYVPNASLAALVTTLFVSSALVFVGLYKRYLRPCPQETYLLKNMLLDKSKEEEPRFKRLELYRQIENAFKSGKGVLLVGEPGSGKTSVMQGFARNVRNGSSGQLSKKLQFFTANANVFKGAETLNHLEEMFGFWRKEVAFYLEEFHALFKKDAFNGDTSDSLKTFCDRFPYVSGSTTTQEYEKYIANIPTIRRRFVVVNLPKEMSKEEIEACLFQFLHTKQPHLDITAKVMDKVYSEAPKFKKNTSGVDAAIALLSSSISKVTDQHFEELQKEIDQKEMNVAALQQKMTATNSQDATELSKLQTLQKNLADQKQLLKNKMEQLAKVRKIEKVYLALKQNSYRFADQPKLERTWLVNEALLKTYDTAIRKERVKLGLAPCLNEALIDQVVQNEGEA